MSELFDLTLTEATRLLRQGDFSSHELVQACLDQVKRLDPVVRAFLTTRPEEALAQADQADRRLSAHRRAPETALPALLGVPLAVKDVLCVAGMPCTCGSRILEGFIPPYNATAVEKVLAAGAIILGKTNTDEFAMGSSTENSAYFTTRNPWDLDRVPGGSSGGSAAAVAARMVPGALGTDTGGSVRQPAAFCGVTGLKPTYGRVSRYGLVAYGSSLDVVGAFGRQSADVEMLFTIIAGHDSRDATTVGAATTLDLPLPSPSSSDDRGNPPQPLQGLRLGIPDEYFIEGIQPAVGKAVMQAVDDLGKLGATVKRVSLPHTAYALPVYYLIAPAEASANLARYDGIRYGPRLSGESMWDVFFQTRGGMFGPEVKRRIMLGTYALSAGYYDAYYGQAQKVRTLIKQDFETAFESSDVIAAPVAPSTAFRIGEHTNDPLAMYLEDVFTLPANLSGVPGLSFPVGFDSMGLPIGMQLMAPHFREEILFRLANAYQQITEWHKMKPGINP